MIVFRSYILFIILGVCSVESMASGMPYVEFTKFKGEALAAVSLTFDDALPSQLTTAIPILDQNGLSATFFIHTDNIKSTWASTWDAWISVVAHGHEVGSHTKSHPALSELSNARRIRDEIEGSAYYIKKNLGVKPISFAYPFSDVNDIVRRKVREVYFIDRDSCRMWGGEGFTAQEGIENIEQAVVKGEWFFCMMHGVDDDSFRPIQKNALHEIAEYLAKHRDTIWTDTYSNVGLYNRERILTEIKFKDVSHGGFMMRLDIPKDVRFRDHMTIPLTLSIALDGHDVKYVKIYDDDHRISTRVSRDGNGLLIDVIPNGKWIQMYWGK